MTCKYEIETMASVPPLLVRHDDEDRDAYFESVAGPDDWIPVAVPSNTSDSTSEISLTKVQKASPDTLICRALLTSHSN